MKIGITFSILAFVALIVSICIKERKKVFGGSIIKLLT